MELVSGRFPTRVFHKRDLKGSKRCLDGWMLSKYRFLRFQSGFNMVSNTCLGALSILGVGT